MAMNMGNNLDRRNMNREFKSTTDPDEIQEWAETRGGTPARDMEKENDLRIIFAGEKDIANLQVISWEEFFELFQENKCKFSYMPEDEEEGQGELSRDYRIETGAAGASK